MQTIDQLGNALPNIPPDEAKYLENEDKAVMSMGPIEKMGAEDQRVAASRWLALRSRRLYFAWKVRAPLARVQIAVNGIDDLGHIPAIAAADFLSGRGVDAQTWPKPVRNEQADRIYRMIGALLPIVDFSIAMNEFLSSETSHQDQLLTEKQRADSKLALLSLPYNLKRALDCDFLKYAFKHR